jgi:hypothetical protein
MKRKKQYLSFSPKGKREKEGKVMRSYFRPTKKEGKEKKSVTLR